MNFDKLRDDFLALAPPGLEENDIPKPAGAKGLPMTELERTIMEDRKKESPQDFA